MSFPYKTILCPIDFDENSLAALDEAVAIARHFNSSLILIHVVPVAYLLGEAPPWGLYDQEKAAAAKLADIARQRVAGLKHEFQLYMGDVITGILDAQKKYQADLLVMATHGRRGIARMVLGSIAEAVVRKVNCSVLTIREKSAPISAN